MYDCFQHHLNQSSGLTMISTNLFFLLTCLLRVVSSSYLGCPPHGPLLARPQHLQDSVYVQNATRQLQVSIDNALAGKIRAGWAVDNVSFSLGLITAHQPSSKPIWEYHHRASSNVNGTKTVDGNTQYLVGSISKLITDLMVLRTGFDLDSPITRYLPQLANKSSVISWPNVTLASLADHLSGIPPNFGFSEFFFLQPLLEVLGFPPIGPDDVANCGIPGLHPICTKDRKSSWPCSCDS
jgi:CubicO group peptidase (beta-lactamase class C family)